MRLFASLVPSPEALAHLSLALEAVRPPAAGGSAHRGGLRWVDPDQWHVTLAFYGEVPDGAWPGLAESLAEHVGPLGLPQLFLRGAGSFSGRNLWIGVAGRTSQDEARLVDLSRAAAAAGEEVGLRPERRERNRSHLTVARAAGAVRGSRDRGRRARRDAPDPSPLPTLVSALAVYSGPTFRAGAVHLVHSRLGEGRGGRPAHEVIASFTPRG